MLLETAKRGVFQEQQAVDVKRTLSVYETTFVLSDRLAEVQLIVDVAAHLRRTKGASVLINGVRVNPWRAYEVLECYAMSLRISDPRAHCWVPVFAGRTLRRWLFPCRLASGYASEVGIFNPAILRAQVEGVIVRRECDWCPQLQLNVWEGKLRKGDGVIVANKLLDTGIDHPSIPATNTAPENVPPETPAG
jgi:hypothetical protein